MKLKVLTVDDSKTIRLIVGKALKPYECEVIEASNGMAGLAAAERERPDLIVLDVTMPVMDGAEMLAKLKSNPSLKSIPVIMLTTEAGRETVLKLARLGVRDYVVKPFKEEMLVDRIGRIVELKPRENDGAARRFDDALDILVVDDKPAIIELIRNAVADTLWNVHGAGNIALARDFCATTPPDIALISLSLPENGANSIFQTLRTNPATKSMPVLAMSVKTSVEEQSRAQQNGFTGIITKPIDADDLKTKIGRALNLDTSYKYFESRDSALVLKLPAILTPGAATEVGAHLRAKIAEAVDSGVDKMILDMSQVEKADVGVVKLGLNVAQMCAQLSLKLRMIGSDAVCSECKNFEETKDWHFEANINEALAALNGSSLASATA